MRRSMASASAFLFFVACGGDDVCGPAECVDELRVNFRGDDSWMTRNYELTVESDGQTLRCFPVFEEAQAGAAGSAGAPGSIGAKCEGDLPFSSFDPPRLILAVTPDSVDVTLIVEGDTWFSRELTPVYDGFRPNGEGCEPECQQGAVTVLIE